MKMFSGPYPKQITFSQKGLGVLKNSDLLSDPDWPSPVPIDMAFRGPDFQVLSKDLIFGSTSLRAEFFGSCLSKNGPRSLTVSQLMTRKMFCLGVSESLKRTVDPAFG